MSRDTTQAMQPLRADGSCFGTSDTSLHHPWILQQPRATSRLDCLLCGRKRPHTVTLCTHFFELQPLVALSTKLLKPVHHRPAREGPAPSTAAQAGPATAPCAPPYPAPPCPPPPHARPQPALGTLLPITAGGRPPPRQAPPGPAARRRYRGP